MVLSGNGDGESGDDVASAGVRFARANQFAKYSDLMGVVRHLETESANVGKVTAVQQLRDSWLGEAGLGACACV